MKKVFLFLLIILTLSSCEVQYRTTRPPEYFYNYNYYPFIYPYSIYGGYPVRTYRIPQYHYQRPQLIVRGRH